MNRRMLCQLTAAILTSDLTTHYVGFMKQHSDYCNYTSSALTRFDGRARGDDVMGNLTVSKLRAAAPIHKTGSRGPCY